MKSITVKIHHLFFVFSALAAIVSTGVWAQNIIQKEKISYEKCLKVIETSQEKLSTSPKISEPASQKRVATFILSDGILTITCDGKEELVIVSTEKN